MKSGGRIFSSSQRLENCLGCPARSTWMTQFWRSLGEMKSYIFRVELRQDEDGRWNAVVPNLRACYTWGKSKNEALSYIQDDARYYVEDMLAHGEPLPLDVEVVDAPVASVTT